MPLLHSPAGLRFLDFLTYPEIAVEEHAFSFMTGKSGCGKSTYLKLLNRTVLPSAGTLYYRGRELAQFPVLAYRKEVMLVPQEVFLFDGTIRDNFDQYCDARGKQRLTEAEMQTFLHICCADFPPASQCASLSGGEKQRVFLSVFLSCLPNVLLLDEPTAALDEKTSFELLQNLKTFCRTKGITVLCVCHNETLVRHFSDAVICLEART